MGGKNLAEEDGDTAVLNLRNSFDRGKQIEIKEIYACNL